jgi:hypothetical protein
MGYFIICLAEVIVHLSNYQMILESDKEIAATPRATKDFDQFQSNNKSIKTFNSIDMAFIVVMTLDVIVKTLNHWMVLKTNFNDNQIPSVSQLDVYFDEPLTFDPFRNDGGLFVIKSDYVIMDLLLVIAIQAMYII